MPHPKRYFFAGLVIFIIIAGFVFVRSMFTAPGLNKPMKVQDGSVQVKSLERVASFEAPDGQKVTPSTADQFVLIDVNVEGTVPLAGSQDLLRGEWQLTDAKGVHYSPSALTSGKLVFEVDSKATGLVLELGEDVKIPLEKPKLALLGNTSRLRMTGNSMEPNLPDGQTVVAEKVDNVATLHRGDIITFTQDGSLMIKRLIALPGETIEIHEGSILINGEVYSEPYKVIPTDYEQESLTLGENEYYVLGDNRSESIDSHSFGAITAETIKGRVVP